MTLISASGDTWSCSKCKDLVVVCTKDCYQGEIIKPDFFDSNKGQMPIQSSEKMICKKCKHPYNFSLNQPDFCLIKNYKGNV